MYCRGIGEGGPLSANHVTLYILIDHWSGGVMCNIRYNGNIWLYPSGNHFSATQSYFFLHCIYYMQAIRKLLVIVFKQSGHFCDHITTNPVIKCATHQVTIC